MISNETAGKDDLHGVRGWLLALCLFLMIGIPLMALLGILAAWQAAQASPLMRSTLTAEIVIELALAGFALYAGWALYRMKSNGVAIAKAYFITMVGIGAFGFISVLLGMLSSQQSANMAALDGLMGRAAFSSLIIMVLFGLCLTYLLSSKRVRATYPHS